MCMSRPITWTPDNQVGAVWVRVGYRNVYFDVQGELVAPLIDGDLVSNIAAAQLEKLKSMPLSESTPIETATTP